MRAKTRRQWMALIRLKPGAAKMAAMAAVGVATVATVEVATAVRERMAVGVQIEAPGDQLDPLTLQRRSDGLPSWRSSEWA
jgi:hypothetical protein